MHLMRLMPLVYRLEEESNLNLLRGALALNPEALNALDARTMLSLGLRTRHYCILTFHGGLVLTHQTSATPPTRHQMKRGSSATAKTAISSRPEAMRRKLMTT